MRTLTVELDDRAYPIHIGTGLLDQADLLPSGLHQRKVSIITNETVAALYLKPVAKAFKSRGVTVVEIVLPDGENHKNWETLNRVYDALLSSRCERSTPLIALGGGVIGDITGFAAATYQRGVPFIQMPTTLLAQVDSSVGGKTAINHPLGKNMIGAFYQPAAVIADMATLDTLPDRELAAGIAEIIKYGLIRDSEFLDWLDANIEKLNVRDSEALAYAVERSCRNKAEVVVRDERETGERALLNFGHTFGHAIEAGMGYGQWLHGEAVAAGMVLAASVSRRLGLLERPEVGRIVDMLKRAKLPVAPPDLGTERYIDLMGHDKKVVGGKMRFILLRKLGEAFISDAVDSETLSIVLSRSADHA